MVLHKQITQSNVPSASGGMRQRGELPLQWTKKKCMWSKGIGSKQGGKLHRGNYIFPKSGINVVVDFRHTAAKTDIKSIIRDRQRGYNSGKLCEQERFR